MTSHLTNNLTILTGGSRGMGLAMAQQLLRPGHTVISIARNASDTLQAPDGATLLQWPLDLADGTAAALRLHDWLVAQQPGRYASATLINNAGAIPRIAPLVASGSTADLAGLASALRVGLEAPMLLTATFLDATEGWGVPRKVLNVSSGLGRRAMASQAAYCAAKAGMDHFTRCLALEEASRPGGAKVCSLAPGVIDTDMQVQLRGATQDDFADVDNFTQLKERGLLSSPADAAARVLAWLNRPDFGDNPVADVREA
ncbi:SDR family oxidoreductase [Comamonas faecalis]|uniref:SDR family oxidoreductase n=1 Tax=Comamonas faecalis TaxID=1387849 RepID=A0ABP7R478_9BURK